MKPNSRKALHWSLPVVTLAALLPAAPAGARPPSPILSSHGAEVRAAYIGHCRPDEHQPCMVPDVFRGTDPLPVHPGGLVRVNTKRRARHVRVEADCGARKPKRRSRTSWSFRIRGTECTHATIEVVYRTTWARYTVSLEDHVHTGASDQ